MKVVMARQEFELGSQQMGFLRDSNSLINNPDALQARMEEDGYLLLRGVQLNEKVLAAREMIIRNMAEIDQLDTRFPLMDAVVKEGARGAFHGGSKALTRDPAFLNLVESPEIMGFFANFLKAEVLTFDYKWLRLVGPGDFTGAHYDIVYMGRGTPNLYTCWTPLGDVSYDLGPLAILSGSHRIDRLKQTYGTMDVDRDHVTGAFSDDPNEMIERFGGQWQTGEFQMGDVLIFGMFTMHASLTNTSNRFRLTSDTRYQRASEPVDERWIGENPMAHYAWTKGETVTMETARKQWNI